MVVRDHVRELGLNIEDTVLVMEGEATIVEHIDLSVVRELVQKLEENAVTTTLRIKKGEKKIESSGHSD